MNEEAAGGAGGGTTPRPGAPGWTQTWHRSPRSREFADSPCSVTTTSRAALVLRAIGMPSKVYSSIASPPSFAFSSSACFCTPSRNASTPIALSGPMPSPCTSGPSAPVRRARSSAPVERRNSGERRAVRRDSVVGGSSEGRKGRRDETTAGSERRAERVEEGRTSGRVKAARIARVMGWCGGSQRLRVQFSAAKGGVGGKPTRTLCTSSSGTCRTALRGHAVKERLEGRQIAGRRCTSRRSLLRGARGGGVAWHGRGRLSDRRRRGGLGPAERRRER